MRTKKIDLVEEQQKQEREKRMTYISTLADQQKVKEKMMARFRAEHENHEEHDDVMENPDIAMENPDGVTENPVKHTYVDLRKSYESELEQIDSKIKTLNEMIDIQLGKKTIIADFVSQLKKCERSNQNEN